MGSDGGMNWGQIMPNVKPGESREDFVKRCIPLVIDDGTAKDGAQAAAVCNSMWRERESKALYECECLECGHTMESSEHCADIECPECGGDMRRADRAGVGRAIVMKMTKVQRLQNGRTRWQARANTGEFDLLQERFDEAFFDDVVSNFYRTQEALSRGDTPPDGMTEPILDISHYSLYLPKEDRNKARAGWPIKMWRDGRELWAQGYFDETRLGQLAEKAAYERKPEDRRVSIVVYPDYSRVEIESGGRKIYRGGNGKAWMDSLAMTSTPCDPGAVMEVKSMSIADDAQKVLGEDGTEIVNQLEEARTQKTLPDGALIKSEDDEQEEEAVEEAVEEQETKTEEQALEAQPITMEDLTGAIDALLPGIAAAIDERFEPLRNKIDELAGKSAQFEEQIKSLGATEAEKVKNALDSGNIFDRMWPNEAELSVQGAGKSTAKGTVQTPTETKTYADGDVMGALGFKK